MGKEMLTIAQFAFKAGVSEVTVRKMVKDGRVSTENKYLMGRVRPLIPASELVRLGYRKEGELE